MKILHSADLHLDAPFAGRTPVQADRLRQALLKIPGQLAELCRRESCDLVLLAGDLFDGPWTRDSYQALYIALEEMGTFSVFMSYAQGMMEPLRWLVDIVSDLITTQVNIERFTNLLAVKSDVIDTPEVIEKYGTSFEPKRKNWEPVHGEIEFKDVWFKYPDSDRYVLQNFNLKINAVTLVIVISRVAPIFSVIGVIVKVCSVDVGNKAFSKSRGVIDSFFAVNNVTFNHTVFSIKCDVAVFKAYNSFFCIA